MYSKQNSPAEGIKEELSTEDSWYLLTEEQVLLEAERFKRRTLNLIDELGNVDFIRHSIDELKGQLYKLKNPTPEQSYKYTETYFNDLIKRAEGTLAVFEDLLESGEEAIDEYMLDYKDRLLKIEDQTQEDPRKAPTQIPPTAYPDNFIMPKDKISNYLADGKLSTSPQELRMERLGSKKELTAVVNIDYEELKGVAMSREFTPYDWQIHNSIVSLFVDGGNEYITPLMIYRTVTGNPNAKLTDNIMKAISESVTKCSITRIRIDATEEAKAYGMDRAFYEGNLIYTEKVVGKHKGNTEEWIRILKPPVLYEYANSKNQVARMDIKLLNTPINKNEDTIALQGYLQKRIMDMKGSKLSRNILYDTVFKQLRIEATSPGALRKKQLKIRRTTEDILTYWGELGFIKGFKENTGPNNSKVSVTIIFD